MNWRFNWPCAFFVTLDRDVARELLALNDPRRTAASDPALVELYAGQMERGEWLFNGDTYKVNRSGALIDGQHRLQAIIRSGWTGLALVCVGVPDEAAWAMDPPGRRAA